MHALRRNTTAGSSRPNCSPSERIFGAGSRQPSSRCSIRQEARTCWNEKPVLRRSIEVRNPYVYPINLVQIELLRRLRGGADDPDIRKAFMVTVNGIAAGMRNTG